MLQDFTGIIGGIIMGNTHLPAVCRIIDAYFVATFMLIPSDILVVAKSFIS